jgi:hypothetical protein
VEESELGPLGAVDGEAAIAAGARPSRVSRPARRVALLLVALVVAFQLQRGGAEAHHDYDAPLTVEAPWALLPCDLALCAYPAVVADPLASSLAWLRLAATGASGFRRDDPGAVRAAPGPSAPDAPRAPPLRSDAPSS